MLTTLVFFLGAFVPLMIFCLSIANLVHWNENSIRNTITKDAAQFIYFVMTILGLCGCSTRIKVVRGWVLGDVISVMLVAISCLLMSSEWFTSTIGEAAIKNVIACVDLVASLAACFFYRIHSIAVV